MLKSRFVSYLVRRRHDLLSGCFILGIALTFLWRVVFQGAILVPVDNLKILEPWRSESKAFSTQPIWNPVITDGMLSSYPSAISAARLWSRGIPRWDATMMMGLPAFARGDLYANVSFNLLRLVMPVSNSIGWKAVLDIFVSILGMYLFLGELGLGRFGRLVGGIAYGLNGYLIGWLSLPTLAEAQAFFPLIAWGIQRAVNRNDWRWSLVGAASFTIQLFAGYILWPFYSVVTLVILFSYQSILAWLQTRKLLPAARPLLYCGIALGLGAALSAPVLLPTVELFLNTARSNLIGAASHLSIHHILRLMAPQAFGSPLNGGVYKDSFNFSETDLYFGALPFVLILPGLFHRQKRLSIFFFSIGAIFYLAVLNFQPFRAVTAFVYPLFVNTFPGRIFFIIAFAWSVVAACGADWVMNAAQKKGLVVLSLLSIGLALLMGGLALLNTHFQSWGLEQIPLIRKLFVRLPDLNTANLLFAGVILLAGAILFLLSRKQDFPRWILAGLFLGVILFDLFYNEINYNPALPQNMAYPETESLQVLKSIVAAESQPVRMVNLTSMFVLPAMIPEIYDIPSASGYTSWALKRYSEYLDLTGERLPISLNHLYFKSCCNLLSNALNIKYVYANPDFANGPMITEINSMQLVYDGKNKIYRNTSALDRAWIVHQILRVEPGDLQKVKEALYRPGFNPAVQAVIEAGASLAASIPADPGPTRESPAGEWSKISYYSDNEVTIDANLTSPGLLVLSDAAYPGWKASVDGKEEPIYTTNLFMRGVLLDAGPHQVKYTYMPTYLIPGIWIASLSILGVILAAIFQKIRAHI